MGHTFYKAGMIGEEKAFPAAFPGSQEQNCVEVHQGWGYHGPRQPWKNYPDRTVTVIGIVILEGWTPEFKSCHYNSILFG